MAHLVYIKTRFYQKYKTQTLKKNFICKSRNCLSDKMRLSETTAFLQFIFHSGKDKFSS